MSFGARASSYALGGGAWTPASLTNLRFWYDASDAASFTYSSGALVSQWNDLSGNGHHLTQGTSGNQPSRNATLNGLDGVTFVTDKFLTHDAGSDAIDVSPWTFWAVVDLTGTVDFDRIATALTSAGANDYQSPSCIFAFRNHVVDGYAIASHSTGTASANAIGVSTAMIIGSRMNGTNVYASVDGTETSGTAATAPSNVRYLRAGGLLSSGGTNGGANSLNGVIFEMFLANADVTATDALTYLQTKWGL